MWSLPPELERVLRALPPGVYVANVRIEGVPEYDILSDALRDATGSRATSYARLVDAYHRELGDTPLVFHAGEEFRCTRAVRRALQRLARRTQVLILGRSRLADLDCTDLTRDLRRLDCGQVTDEPVLQPGTTHTLLPDTREVLQGVAVAGLTLLLARALVTGTTDFWTLTALGLAGLMIGKLA